MGVKNPWEPVQTYSNTQTPRLPRELPVNQGHQKDGGFGVLTTQVNKLSGLEPQFIVVACNVWPGLLRYRNDVGQRRSLRYRPFWCRSVSCLTPPGRSDDCRRSLLREDGSDFAPDL